MTEPVVLREVDAQGLALITLNRPQVLNALSRDLLDHLAATIDEIAAKSQVRVIILTGAGRAFCAGFDLKEIGAGRGGLGQPTPAAAGDPVAARHARALQGHHLNRCVRADEIEQRREAVREGNRSRS